MQESLIEIEEKIRSEVKAQSGKWISKNLATLECDHYSPKACTTKKDEIFSVLLTVKGNPGFQMPLGLFSQYNIRRII